MFLQHKLETLFTSNLFWISHLFNVSCLFIILLCLHHRRKRSCGEMCEVHKREGKGKNIPGALISLYVEYVINTTYYNNKGNHKITNDIVTTLKFRQPLYMW